ncbi:MAG: hypothetical protein J6U22_08380 [Bacteroidaceae bacterium]|nr:hypothetical protein [Bacteroidaceae bacterium]
MTETRYYTVAEHLLGVKADDRFLPLMQNYEPFRHDISGKTDVERPPLLFTLTVTEGRITDYIEEYSQEDEGQDTICGHTAGNDPVFEFRWDGKTAGLLVCTPDYRQGTLHLSGHDTKAALDNSLMILFAMASSCTGTALFHAAAVSLDGRGYMFLGKSGTGKSTHASLWLKNIPGSGLMNDDNPAVRVKPDGTAVVYGTPWSGKTPCYRNVSAPLGGIVLLSQAPYNSITRLKGIGAYAAVVPSISGKRWDSRIADGLHDTENALATSIPVWHLDCLPDAEAARLCKETITV